MMTLRSARTRISISLFSCLAAAIVFVPLAHAGPIPALDGNLKLWLDASQLGLADGALVGTWADASGAGNNATQASADKHPSFVTSGIGGLPTVRFAGGAVGFEDLLVTPDFVSTPAPYTIFTVSQLEGSQNLRLISSGSVNWLLGNWGGGENRMFADGWTQFGGAAPPVPPRPVIYSAHGGDGTTSFSRDGLELANNTLGLSSPGSIALGGSGVGAGGEWSKGDVSEVLVYDRVLTPSEQRQVGLYLENRYNIRGSSDRIRENVALHKPIVDGSSSWSATDTVTRTGPHDDASSPYNSSHVTDGSRLTSTESGGQFWLSGEQDKSGQYFVVDLEQARDVRSISLRNSNNGSDRGTRNFQIRGSNNLAAIQGDTSTEPVVLAGTLTGSMGVAGDYLQPEDVFSSVNGLSEGSYRYLRFEVLSTTFSSAAAYAGGGIAGSGLAGLSEIAVFETRLSANVVGGKPIVDGSGSWGQPAGNFNTGLFPASSITDHRADFFRDDANPERTSYWLGQDVSTGAAAFNEHITIDLEGTFQIDRLELQNGNNGLGGGGDRGTDHFEIWAATAGDGTNPADFTLVFSGQLTDTRDLTKASGQDIPFDIFSSAHGDFNDFSARYLKFVATDFHQNGAGLAELRAFGDNVIPEPSSLLLAALGLLGMVTVRFRRRKR
jgi:hypothetical protein